MMTTTNIRLLLSAIALVLAVVAYPCAVQAKVDAEFGSHLNSFSFMVWGAFVMWMCAGFCMIESGSVRTKNVSLICLKNLGLYAIAALTYYILGYNLMYVDVGDFIGTFQFLYNPSEAEMLVQSENGNMITTAINPQYSPMSLWLFQMVFLTTTISIVSGSLAERVKIWPFLIFVLLHTLLIYPIVGAWAWGGGWLHQLGFKDFAGSSVVHTTGAASALAAAIVVGARSHRFRADGTVRPIPPSNVLVVTLGVFILWLGWFGFNGGSQFSLDSARSVVAMSIVIVNTNLAAGAGTLVALALSRVILRRMDLMIVLNGAVAGLVAISAAPDILNHNLAIVVGGVGGLLSIFGVKLLERLRIDDGVGAIPVHLSGGIWGTLAVSISQPIDIFVQLTGVISIFAYSFIAAFVIWKGLDLLVGVRASYAAEKEGLDSALLHIYSYPEFMLMPERDFDDNRAS